ncbi:MAG TPA: tetratricopeptide repeat protein [Candidatus Acidoferrum sp.]|nr:tetratricopeptide repeat protein [Candidatus Acidoferrum sp.]
MKLRNLVVASAGALLLALTSFAQISAIEGDVKGEDGQPAVKATIKIVRTDIKGSYHCDTNKKGHYFYNGLPLGTYNITVEINGKEMDGVNGVKTRLGDPTPVNFDLQKIAATRNAKAAQQQSQVATGQPLTKEQERGMSKEQKEAYDKAIKDREASMKKNKELNDAFNAGLTAAQNKDYDAAATEFAKASEMDPKQPAVWSNLADAYVNSAKKKTGAEFDATMGKGMEAFQKAIELNPNDAGLHNNYALALAQSKKFPEMQAELEKAAQIEPTKAGQYYYNLGAILVNTNQNEAAGAAFKKAIEIDPNHADSYYQYGVYLVGKASISADGKVTPVAGTVDAFQKYLALAPTGQFADQAKAMLTSMDAKVDTTYKNPTAPATKKKK